MKREENDKLKGGGGRRETLVEWKDKEGRRRREAERNAVEGGSETEGR